MTKRQITVAIRWTLAVVFLCFGIHYFTRSGNSQQQNDAMLGFFCGLGALVGVAALISPELIGWVVTPINILIDSVLQPSESSGPPPADYKTARFYSSQTRYAEAADEYAKIVRYHPEEITAYLEGIPAARLGDQPKLAEKLYRDGLRRAPDEETRGQLRVAYENEIVVSEDDNTLADQGGIVPRQYSTE